MKRAVLVVVAILAVALLGFVVYLLTWPVPIEPEAWEAPVYDPTAWTPTGFTGGKRVTLPDGHGPEDIQVDEKGRVFGGLQDGRILRWDDPDAAPTELVNTGGRPLGLHMDAQGRLLVADAFEGLLRVDPDSGAIEVLATECGGRPLVFTDDLEVATDGTIWFSDASTQFTQPEWKMDILQNRPLGRLCSWDPTTGLVTEVVKDLYFANGIAVDPFGRFVLVNETDRYRVRKLWLEGERAGQVDVLIDNLPGFPDGISTGTDGTFWIALASPRNPIVDAASDKPWLRKLMVRLPDALQPAPEHTARAIGVDADGNVLHDLFDPEGTAIWMSTSVQEHDGRLYIGSLEDDGWASAKRP